MLVFIIFLWVLMGLVAMVPYLEQIREMHWSRKIITPILFMALGPVLGMSVVVYMFLFYYMGGEEGP